MFVDQAQIIVTAGNGGDGCVSFLRMKYIPKGGPSGGDGGDGGSVILKADPSVNTLLDFRGRHHWKAGNAEPGRSKQQHGANGRDRIIRMPPGTLVYDAESDELLCDLGPDDTVVIARGGKGGFGNEHFKSAINQTPRQFIPGERGQHRTLRLELKLIADAGLVGMPNAGKSTFLSSVTRAEPKIADYPFTTLSPQLGIAELDPARRMVLADIPGLIEGAAGGAGLGHDFLRHIERTRVLVHMLDLVPLDGSDPIENYRTIRGELAGYSQLLAGKPEIIVLNKADLLPDDADRKEISDRIARELNLDRDENPMLISAATGKGTRQLLEALWARLHPTGVSPEGWSV